DPRQTTQKDQIKFAAVGLGSVPDIAWQNRPTFQQVVDVPSHRPRSAAPVTAAVAAAAAGSASVAQLPNTAATGGAAAGLAGLIVAGFTSGVRRRRRRRAPE